MDAFTQARAELKATLEAAGIDNVTLDPRLEPPGVLVDAPSSVEPANGGATWTLVIPVRLIAPPPGNADALDWLLATLEPVMVAIGIDEARARAGTYSLNDKDCPAYSVEVSRVQIVPC